jgi:hypothetical protein
MRSTKVLRYIELKSGYADNGPAWIASVTLSRSGRALYFGHKLLKRGGGQLVSGNYFDAETGEEYWVSGVKKDGHDRHPAGSGMIGIESGAVNEYLALVGLAELNKATFNVIPDLAPPDRARIHAHENRKLE